MKSSAIRYVLVVAGSLGIAASACAAQPEKLVFAYEANAVETAPAPLPSACSINIVSIADKRNNVDSINADYPISAGEPLSWIGTGLGSLKAYGYGVQQNATPLANAVNLDVELIRSYTWFGNMRINAMVAMDVGVTPAGGERKVLKFRASGSKVNMWGATSEHLTALNYAFNNLMNKMAATLQAACTESKLAVK